MCMTIIMGKLVRNDGCMLQVMSVKRLRGSYQTNIFLAIGDDSDGKVG